MPIIFLSDALEELAQKRPVFHSEADFQHSLAWEIHQRWQKCSIRLEFKPPNFNKRIYLDIWASEKDSTFAIELKYKTRRLHININGESYDLLDQSAQDIARYDFLKDIQRLEDVTSAKNDTIGYALFLTNDSAYWKLSQKKQPVDINFRIHHQRRILPGDLNWGYGASKKTMENREEPIIIHGAYDLNWVNFSSPSGGPYGVFKYLLVEVGSKHIN